jgi:large subunit ribosomal protein L31
MKEKIHPKYIISTVKCVCGNEFITKSTRGDIKLEICSACHPFFTGKQRLLDTEGRVEKFKKRFAATGGKTLKKAKKKKTKKISRPKGRILTTAPKKALKAKKIKEKPKKAKKEAKKQPPSKA